uniref:Uncharacterized protein n=1 Tax=Rhizophora mucronata TaxID=61149 RepID=A0A2P2PKE1_RHIMU
MSSMELAKQKFHLSESSFFRGSMIVLDLPFLGTTHFCASVETRLS